MTWVFIKMSRIASLPTWRSPQKTVYPYFFHVHFAMSSLSTAWILMINAAGVTVILITIIAFISSRTVLPCLIITTTIIMPLQLPISPLLPGWPVYPPLPHFPPFWRITSPGPFLTEGHAIWLMSQAFVRLSHIIQWGNSQKVPLTWYAVLFRCTN